MAAGQHHNAYEKQAQKEKLDQIAMLFAAMAASQSITVHHVQQLLADLMGKPQQRIHCL
jgi:rubrerythrin